MQHILDGREGLTLLLALNSDRVIAVATLVLALLAGAYLGPMLVEAPAQFP